MMLALGRGGSHPGCRQGGRDSSDEERRADVKGSERDRVISLLLASRRFATLLLTVGGRNAVKPNGGMRSW
jgi:hypothetical protein